MSGAATVGSHGRLRIFCGLTLPPGVRRTIAGWQRDSLQSGGRIVEPSNLHITLAFLGSRPPEDVARVAQALEESTRTVRDPIVLSAQRYRETRSVAMLVLADEEERAGRLAHALHERLERIGVYEPESRRWLPHVTVLRVGSRPGLRPPLPALAPFSPSGAAVYHSQLGRGGARYEVLESVPLGG